MLGEGLAEGPHDGDAGADDSGASFGKGPIEGGDGVVGYVFGVQAVEVGEAKDGGYHCAVAGAG